jgi:hypothetical protein
MERHISKLTSKLEESEKIIQKAISSKFKLETSQKNLLKAIHEKSAELVLFEEASSKLRKESVAKDETIGELRG